MCRFGRFRSIHLERTCNIIKNESDRQNVSSRSHWDGSHLAQNEHKTYVQRLEAATNQLPSLHVPQSARLAPRKRRNTSVLISSSSVRQDKKL